MLLKHALFAGLLLVVANSGLARGQQNGEAMVPGQQTMQEPAKVQFVSVNGQPVLVQFTYVGPPKVLPIATADSYPEGSTINLVCTVSGGQRKGLTQSWRLNGRPLDEEQLAESNVNIANTYDVSILRITNSTSENSGAYTCEARNPLGQDSTTVRIMINVDLKWKQAPSDVEIGLGRELVINCEATGYPEPTIEWRRVNGGANATLSMGKQLRILRTRQQDSGLYECVARNGVHQDLSKVIQIRVRGE